MEDPRSRFIEAATRPFADQAETRLAAKSWLETHVDGDDSQLEEAVQRWENRKPHCRGWWIAYFGAIALISAVVWIAITGDTLEHMPGGRSPRSLRFLRRIPDPWIGFSSFYLNPKGCYFQAMIPTAR